MNNLADPSLVQGARRDALERMLALGDRQYKSGELEAAAETYALILTRIPDELTALNCLSRTRLDQGNPVEALELGEQALAVRRDVADSLLSKANALAALGRPGEAAEVFAEAVDLRPQDPFAQFNLASCLAQTGNFDRAEKAFREALTLKPRWEDALIGLGRVRLLGADAEGAARTFQELMDLNPHIPGAVALLGIALQQAERWDDALPHLEAAARSQPHDVAVLAALGEAQTHAGALEAAFTTFTRALALAPGDLALLSRAGTAALALNLLDEAHAWFEQAVSLAPEDEAHRANYIAALKRLGRYDELERFLDGVLTRNPEDAASHVEQAGVLLRSGRFDEGWRAYQWRFRASEPDAVLSMLPVPDRSGGLEARKGYRVPWTVRGADGQGAEHRLQLWNGEPLSGKSILVLGEQGVGDEVMYASLLPELGALAPDRVYLTCDPRLESLFQRAYPAITVKGKDRDLDLSWTGGPDGGGIPDFYLPSADLALFFRNHADDFTKPGDYLSADETLKTQWRAKLDALGPGLKVGLSWRGGGEPEIIRRRSIGFADWQALAGDGIHFVNLQYGATAEEIAAAKAEQGLVIHDWPDNDPRDKLDDLAALIQGLDLVVTVDNSTAHFAGALSVPTWVLVDPAWDWRWPASFGDSAPFCQHIRPFRATEFYAWGDVIEAVGRALADLKAQR